PGKLAWDAERTLAVTAQALRVAVGTWLATPNRVVLRFRPEGSARSAAAGPDRSKQPPLAPDAHFQGPVVGTDRLPNGLELYVVDPHELPLVSAALGTRAGSTNAPPGKEGLAVLVGNTMERGTRTRAALGVANAFGDLGTSLRTDAATERVAQYVEVQK